MPACCYPPCWPRALTLPFWHLWPADALGNMASTPDTIAAAPGWTPDTQLRLAAEVLSQELEQEPEVLLDKVRLT